MIGNLEKEKNLLWRGKFSFSFKFIKKNWLKI